MEAILLGTGCPAADPLRCGAATLLRGGGAAVLVDCGAGAVHRCLQAGQPPRELDAVVLTHLHSDHLVDLYQLIVSAWHAGRDRPWRVLGPAPVLRHVEGLMALWADERAARVAFERRPSTAALEIEPVELRDGMTVPVGGMTMTAVEVDHRPVVPALGLVAEADAAAVVVSGDTRRCDALIEAGRGCDLLIHECFLHREMAPVPGVRSAETVEAVASYHTLSSEVGGVARDMEAGALMLTHFVPPRFDRAALLTEVRETWDGPLMIGEDLMAYDCKSRSVRFGGAVVGM